MSYSTVVPSKDGVALMRSQFVEQVKRHEGLRLKPYKDTVGKLTIGYGRNLDDVGISKDEAEMMLLHDLAIARDELIRRYPIVLELNKPRQEALTNMCFNMGIARLSKFKKMWEAIARNDFNWAADEMLDSLWADQVGKRAEELSDIMATGEYPS